MGFIHVLSTIGRDALKVGSVAAGAMPGPLGFLAKTALNIASQEVNGGTGQAKREAVMSAVADSAPAHPDKLALISRILEGVVEILNAASELFSLPPEPARPPETK